MRYELLYRPSFSVARVLLEGGQAIRAESGAMVSMSASVTIDSKMQGGFGKALGRLFTGESLFQTTFTATGGPGEVILAPGMVGDVLGLELNGPGMMVTSGCFLACDTGLEMETKVQGRGFFAGEGLFIMRVSGQGSLLLSSFGAIHQVDLPAGVPYVVDTGHIVAFSETMSYQVRKVATGIVNTLKSGEGLVAEFMGPGTIYLQTRNAPSFASWIGQHLPSRS